jgi:peptidoglycan-associated lipoprotein
MKLTNTITLLAVALSFTLAVTGCKSKHPDVTKLPDRAGGTTGSGRGPGEGEKVPATDLGKVTDASGGLSTADFNVDDFNQDRAALAGSTVHFDFDSSVVKASEKGNVEAVAAALKSDTAAKLLIEGHCDERGTEEYNRSLGERRALALRESLATLGTDPMRVKTISYGEDKPADPGHDEAAWRKNRRGEFVLLHPK